MTKQKIVIIGSGLAGLAAACVAAARGHTVSVYDKNPWLGGKAAQLEGAGYRFDMGPTILTVPSVLKRIFAEAGRKLEDYLDLRRLDPQWRCFFDDQTVLDLEENIPAMAQRLQTYAGAESAVGYEKFMALSQRLNSISQKFFFWRSVAGLQDTMNMRDNFKPGTLSDVMALRMGHSVAGTIRSHVPDARVAQMLDHFTQYVGSSPYNSPAVLCGIAHMQTDEGIWYPIGGTRAVPEALVKLGRELGVSYHPNTDIAKITTARGRVTGVTTASGESIAADTVISNMDSVRTYRELLDQPVTQKFERDWQREPACSGVVFYWGLTKAYDHLLHHNFVFSRDPHEEFEWIYNKGEPAPDPSAYIAATTRTEPGTAPEGGEALYVLVHTPYLRSHHDWQKMLPDYRRVVIDKLQRTAGMPDLAQRIAFESVLTPQDIHDRYKVLNGAIYGLASHGKYLGAFKPGNRSPYVQGLYLAGGAAHPGPGMPMVMMSGWIAADCADQDARAGAKRAA
jgi:phytoene desaturase